MLFLAIGHYWPRFLRVPYECKPHAGPRQHQRAKIGVAIFAILNSATNLQSLNRNCFGVKLRQHWTLRLLGKRCHETCLANEVPFSATRMTWIQIGHSNISFSLTNMSFRKLPVRATHEAAKCERISLTTELEAFLGFLGGHINTLPHAYHIHVYMHA